MLIPNTLLAAEANAPNPLPYLIIDTDACALLNKSPSIAIGASQFRMVSDKCVFEYFFLTYYDGPDADGAISNVSETSAICEIDKNKGAITLDNVTYDYKNGIFLLPNEISCHDYMRQSPNHF